MAKDVIIALDFPTREETLAFLDKFPAGEKPFVKIGMELYYAEGPEIVRQIKARGHKIFLDLKLHDIPNTVKKSMAVLSGLGADIVNLHAAGTKAMMEAALEGLTRPDGTRPLLIAVTQLDIGKIPLKVITEGSLVYSLVVQKTVAPGAVSSVAVAE